MPMRAPVSRDSSSPSEGLFSAGTMLLRIMDILGEARHGKDAKIALEEIRAIITSRVNLTTAPPEETAKLEAEARRRVNAQPGTILLSTHISSECKSPMEEINRMRRLTLREFLRDIAHLETLQERRKTVTIEPSRGAAK
jgi:hypothetical protein